MNVEILQFNRNVFSPFFHKLPCSDGFPLMLVSCFH